MMTTTHSISRQAGALWLALALLLAVWPAGATADSTASRAAMSDAELEQRLAFIEARLDKRQPGARRWQYGWTGFYSLTSAGQAFAALDSDDNDDQLNYAVGAVKSAGGLALLLLKPQPALGSKDTFATLPAQNRAQRLDKLEQGEALLRDNALHATERFTWRRHALGIAGNLLGGAVIAAYGDSGDALTSTLVGIAVSEATIWSEPTGAARDLEDYRNRNWNSPSVRGGRWRLLAGPGAVALEVKF
jgi:hypothetical protein